MPVMVSRSGGGRRGRRTISEINMVPFIDVMLVLLIIFMVTAPLISPSVVDLPSVGKAKVAPEEAIQVLVASDESIKLQAGANATAQPIDIKALANGVKALQPKAGSAGAVRPVVIAADKAVKYEAVVRVMDTLQRAGVQRVGLAVQTTP
jgi:biopolymer transport protein TolR